MDLLRTTIALLVARRPRTDRGASLVEYALLVALIALVCVAAVSFFGQQTSSSFNSAATSLRG